MVYCKGIGCPVRISCKRYTSGLGVTMYDGTGDTFIRKCTNLKRYVQDKTKINKDSQNILEC